MFVYVANCVFVLATPYVHNITSSGHMYITLALNVSKFQIEIQNITTMLTM